MKSQSLGRQELL